MAARKVLPCESLHGFRKELLSAVFFINHAAKKTEKGKHHHRIEPIPSPFLENGKRSEVDVNGQKQAFLDQRQ